MQTICFEDPDIKGAAFANAGAYLLLDRPSLDDAQDDEGNVAVQLNESELTAMAQEPGTSEVLRLYSDATLTRWVPCNGAAVMCYMSSPAERLFISRRDLKLMARTIGESRGIPALANTNS